MAPFVNIGFTSYVINSDPYLDIWACFGTFSWNGSSWKSFLTQISILIFLGRLSEVSNLLKNIAVFQVEVFLFTFLGKGLVPKDAHVLIDVLVQSSENLFLVEVRLCWERFPSLFRKLLPSGLQLTSVVVETLEMTKMMLLLDLYWTSTLWMIKIASHSASVKRGSFKMVLCHCYSHSTSDILPWTLSLS